MELTRVPLSDEEFKQLIRIAPLVSIDIVIENERGQILLGKRVNQPAKDMLFVPGGRILKLETREQAFHRLLDEVSVHAPFTSARLLGVYDHIHDSNYYNEPNLSTHYTSIVYHLRVGSESVRRGDNQHSFLTWKTLSDAEKCSEVHQFAKNMLTDISKYNHDDPDWYIGDVIAYDSMMQHYTHYDAQFWSRTQLLIAVQGGILLFGTSKDANCSGFFPWVSFCGLLLTIAIYLLLLLDQENRNKNIDVMDNIAARISSRGMPRPWLRKKNDWHKLFEYFSTKIGPGTILIRTTVILCGFGDVGLLGWYFFAKTPFGAVVVCH